MIAKYNKKSDLERVAQINEKLQVAINNGSQTVERFLSLGAAGHLFKDFSATEFSLEDEIQAIVNIHGLEDNIDVQITKNEIVKCIMHKKAIESIFLNLFTNTIKYNNKKPKAQIQFLKNDKHKIFIYKDNGIGLTCLRMKTNYSSLFKE